MADIKHQRHDEALSGVKASKARLLSEAEARRKEKTQKLARKKMQAVTEEMREPQKLSISRRERCFKQSPTGVVIKEDRTKCEPRTRE